MQILKLQRLTFYYICSEGEKDLITHGKLHQNQKNCNFGGKTAKVQSKYIESYTSYSSGSIRPFCDYFAVCILRLKAFRYVPTAKVLFEKAE